MSKQSVKTAIVDKYSTLNLIELEKVLNRLQQRQNVKPTSALAQEVSAVRIALQQRQHSLKAEVMSFEQTNNHHLLFFTSTQGFAKLAGHSALFFAMTIAERINWRCSLKPDTDHYSPSEDGIIAFKSLERISTQLSQINIYPDKTTSTPELHYFKLQRIYNPDQIAKLRDNSRQNIKRISEIVLPASPIPSLYESISQASQLIYYLVKHSADGLFRDTIGYQMIDKACRMSNAYLRYASLKGRSNPEDLVLIADLSNELRHTIAFGTKIQVIHHRDARKILEELIRVDRIARAAHNRTIGHQAPEDKQP